MRMRTLVVAVLTLAGCAGEDEGPEEDGLPTPDTLSWELAELDPAGVPVDLAEDGSVLLMKPRLAGFLLWEGGDARTVRIEGTHRPLLSASRRHRGPRLLTGMPGPAGRSPSASTSRPMS